MVFFQRDDTLHYDDLFHIPLLPDLFWMACTVHDTSAVAFSCRVHLVEPLQALSAAEMGP